MQEPRSCNSPGLLQKILAAMSGTIITSLVTTPLDVIKTRLQVQLNPSLSSSSISSTGAQEIHIKGMFDGVSKIIRTEGPASLWRGLSPTLIMQVPSTVLYYIGYEKLRDMVTPITPSYSPLIAGGSARILTALVVSPLELVRTRVQANAIPPGMKSMFGDMSTIASSEGSGVRSLWRGIGPTLWRDVPFSGIYWISYENLKPRFDKMHKLQPFQERSFYQQFMTSFASGAVSGMIAALITTPFDVAKTQSQVNPTNDNMIMSMRKIVLEEGVEGLFRGVIPRIAKTAPACAIMISVYEVGNRKLF